MEDYPDIPKSPEAPAPKEEKKELRSRFLRSLWRRMGWSPAGTLEGQKPKDLLDSEKEDEDSVESKPDSRTGKLLNWILGKTVKKQPLRERKRPTTAETAANEAAGADEVSTAPEVSEPGAEPNPLDPEIITEPSPEAFAETHVEAEPEAEPATAPEVINNLPPPPEVAPPLPPIDHLPGDELLTLSGVGGGGRAETRPELSTIPVHRHGEPLGLLAAIGVLAERFKRRRAVRRLERDYKRQERNFGREQKKLSHKIEQLKVETQKRQAETRRQIERDKESLASRMSVNRGAERLSPEKPAARPLVLAEKAPVARPELRREVIAALAERHYERTRPEVVLQQVEKAAEKNIPLEGLYERSQEIKDVPGEPIDAALRSLGQAAQAQAQTMSAFDQQLQEPANQPAANESQDLYKTAAISGVWGAFILIILFTIMLVIGR